MKYAITIADWYWVQGSDKEMIYIDYTGEKFVGPKHKVEGGRTYLVEISNLFLEDGNRCIAKFIKQINRRQLRYESENEK